MPKYQYRCNDCGADLEVQQKFTDDALTVCPECQGDLRKVFGAVGVVFKGSGFYKTDNRASQKSSSSSAPKPAEKKTTESSPATSAA
ncbi:FmdB family zinc ribbon protein [Tessaracoccus oleiagri]|uniref:Putative regulatory protein, FmdB family n=1 Tax=Tessaracoccus oleiagri TaxID=686624 RepID=A0A1G9K1Z3_9ACTN|nr:FmdB family zinc ribbon protein [Tessaracoccus oleiagri]SDL43223.1 putative regulatory protein, FmdB family [Tessaracoccus oleiagri]